MTNEARMIGYALLKTATLVPFRVLSEEVLDAPGDAAEFGLRLELKFIPHEDEDDEVTEAIAEWGAFGFIFALGVLSFAEAKPRKLSEFEHEETDEFKLADFFEGLRFVCGELHFDATIFAGAGSRLASWRARTEQSCSKRSVVARRHCGGSIS